MSPCPINFLLHCSLRRRSPTIAHAKPRPIPVKVVVVAMFEVGADTGDQPGELQYWVERDHLDRIYPLPAGYHAARMNADGEMAVLTGQGTAHAAATIMALGLDPRFDLTHAYSLIAGIAGGSPDKISLGSAAWARWVVDGDLGYEIDAREIPPDWTTGYSRCASRSPMSSPPRRSPARLYALNKPLAEWAYNLTRSTPLADSDKLKEIRANFDGAPPSARPSSPWAMKSPPRATGTAISRRVGRGVAALLHQRPGRIRHHGHGRHRHAAIARVPGQRRARRRNRILILRTVSNFDRQPRGMSAAESLATQRIG